MSKPTYFKPEFCEQMFEHAKAGRSAGTFAINLGLATSTIRLWFKTYPAFREAFDRGRNIYLKGYYERQKKSTYAKI